MLIDRGAGSAWLVFPLARVNLTEARSVCRRYGGDLVTIPNATVNAALVSKVTQYMQGFRWLWTGLVAPDDASGTSGENVWYWMSTGHTAVGYGYNNWDTDNGEPEAGYYCSQLDTNDGTWISYSCGDRVGFVCDVGKCGVDVGKRDGHAEVATWTSCHIESRCTFTARATMPKPAVHIIIMRRLQHVARPLCSMCFSLLNFAALACT